MILIKQANFSAFECTVSVMPLPSIKPQAFFSENVVVLATAKTVSSGSSGGCNTGYAGLPASGSGPSPLLPQEVSSGRKANNNKKSLFNRERLFLLALPGEFAAKILRWRICSFCCGEFAN